MNNSRKVFEEAKKEVDEKYKAEEGDGFFARAGKWLAKTVTRATVDFKATFMSMEEVIENDNLYLIKDGEEEKTENLVFSMRFPVFFV